MKKHNLLKIVLITILVVALLTWILPTTSVQYGEVAEGARTQLGVFDLITYSTLTVSYFGTLFAFILAVGAFYGVLSKTGAYRTLLDKIVDGFKGKEGWFLAIVMILIAAITSMAGLNYAVMFVFPLVIAIILLMGYNKLVAASATVGALLIGIMGTTYGIQNMPYVYDLLSTTAGTEIYTKILIFVIGLVLLVFNVLRYANKVRSNVDLVEEDFVPSKEKAKKRIWPIILIFDLALVVMIMAFIPWKEVFGLGMFETATTWVQEFKLFGFPIFAKLLGTISAFGTWTMQQLPMIIIMATIMIALSYRVKFNDFIKGLLDGMKRMIGPVAIMTLIYTVLIIMTYHPIQLTITKFLLELTSGFNVVTVGLSVILASVFNVDMSYVAQSTLPYITTVITDQSLYPLISIMVQSLYGFVMLVAPTSIVLMGTLAYLKIPYGQWLKHIWKLLLQLFIVLFVIFTIVMFI